MLAGGRRLCACDGNGSGPGAGSRPLEVTGSTSPADSTTRVNLSGKAQPPWAPPALGALSSSQGQCWQPLRHGWVGRLSRNAYPMSQPSPKGCAAAKPGATVLSPGDNPSEPAVPSAAALFSLFRKTFRVLLVWGGSQWFGGSVGDSGGCNGFGDQQLWMSAHGHGWV